MLISFHVRILCMYHILSYIVYFHITYLILSCHFIYTYSYNFYYLSSLHAYCMSISFGTCFMSLAYLLSILLLYSCFYTLQIPILFIFPFYDLLHSMYYYLYLFLDCVYIMSNIICISFAYTCHIFYTYHFLLGFMSSYTLEADTGNNCMYP